MAIIPSFFMDAVVALGLECQNGGKRWIGTGFIVSRKDADDPTSFTYFIITNKHVVENQSLIYIRFNSTAGEFVKDYPVHLRDENGNTIYSKHPNESSDVIAFQISPQTLINDKSIWGAFSLEDHALTLSQMQQTGVVEGSLVYALGFPMNLVETIKTPICRLGCISRVTDAFILSKNNPIFLVDAQTFPGNSGGPIIYRPEETSIKGTPTNTSANLIGILSAYIPYRDTLVSQQTNQPIMIREENSGLTIVHPVDRIKEVVELEWKRLNGTVEEQNATENSTQAVKTAEVIA